MRVPPALAIVLVLGACRAAPNRPAPAADDPSSPEAVEPEPPELLGPRSDAFPPKSAPSDAAPAKPHGAGR